MQKMLGYMRKAIQEYDMLSDGDSVAAGISGGKDSLVMLLGLQLLRRFIGIDYSVHALAIDPVFGGKETDYTAIRALCDEYDIPFTVVPTHIAEVVFDIRKEPNPCSLCSRMRRGALLEATREIGCSKLALGHNRDDAVETFFMNLFNEGRIDCFSPVSYMSHHDVTVIRPLVKAPEREVAGTARKLGLPVLKSACPEDGHTNREEVRQFILEKEREDRRFQDKITGALKRAGISRW